MLLQPTRFAFYTWGLTIIIGTITLAMIMLPEVNQMLFGLALLVPAMVITFPGMAIFAFIARIVAQKAETPVLFHAKLFAVTLVLGVLLLIISEHRLLMGVYVVSMMVIQLVRLLFSIKNIREKALW